MAWKDKKDKFIYTIRTLAERDQIEQTTTKILITRLILIRYI